MTQPSMTPAQLRSYRRFEQSLGERELPGEVRTFLLELRKHQLLAQLQGAALAHQAAEREPRPGEGRAAVGHNVQGRFDARRLSDELSGRDRLPRDALVEVISEAYATKHEEPVEQVRRHLKHLHDAAIGAAALYRERREEAAREAGRRFPTHAELSALRNERTAAQSERDRAWAERDEIRARLERTQQLLDDLQQRYEDLSAVDLERSRTVERLQARVAELLDEINRLRGEVAERDRTLADSRAANTTLEQHTLTLRSEVDQLTASIADLHRRMDTETGVRQEPGPDSVESLLTGEDGPSGGSTSGSVGVPSSPDTRRGSGSTLTQLGLDVDIVPERQVPIPPSPFSCSRPFPGMPIVGGTAGVSPPPNLLGEHCQGETLIDARVCAGRAIPLFALSILLLLTFGYLSSSVPRAPTQPWWVAGLTLAGYAAAGLACLATIYLAGTLLIVRHRRFRITTEALELSSRHRVRWGEVNTIVRTSGYVSRCGRDCMLHSVPPALHVYHTANNVDILLGSAWGSIAEIVAEWPYTEAQIHAAAPHVVVETRSDPAGDDSSGLSTADIPVRQPLLTRAGRNLRGPDTYVTGLRADHATRQSGDSDSTPRFKSAPVSAGGHTIIVPHVDSSLRGSAPIAMACLGGLLLLVAISNLAAPSTSPSSGPEPFLREVSRLDTTQLVRQSNNDAVLTEAAASWCSNSNSGYRGELKSWYTRHYGAQFADVVFDAADSAYCPS